MKDRTTTIGALTSCYDELEILAADLSAEEWSSRSLCPDWTVQGVVTHLVGVEDLLLGWAPSADDEPPPFERMAGFVRETADLAGAELATRAGDTLRARRRELAAMEPDRWSAKCMTPIGPATYGRFMQVRVFDFWVHQRDMTIPLGRETDDSGPAAEIALDEVHGSMGYIVGKKIGLPDGMSIGFDLSGGVDRTIYATVDGRAAVVDHVADPDVMVTADTTTFIMLACGRVDPEAEIAAGRISWSGDDAWGNRAAHNLRFTM